MKENSISKKIIYNAFKSNHFFHSWILYSENENSINENLLFLISQITNKNINKIANIQNYSYVLDALNENINKNVFDNIIHNFSLKNQKNEFKILVIKNIESLHISVLNSLLKFIEEPYNDVFIIMTSKNSKKILKTILSRSFVINCRSELKDQEFNEFINNNDLIIEKKIYLYLFENKTEIEAYNIEKINLLINRFLNFIKSEKLINFLIYLTENFEQKSEKIIFSLLKLFLNLKLNNNINNDLILDLKTLKKINNHNYLNQKKITKILILIEEFEKNLNYNLNFSIKKTYFIAKINEILNQNENE
ncbi:hypothetical protein [[Mycoplasma] collis]|uniref:hypothetical protein n=1 Tax=[Mycoplasma] collis TaxID=2127 RepID=UPI00051B6565|nr:hypothetical protein [[Mycoplasma] collis]